MFIENRITKPINIANRIGCSRENDIYVSKINPATTTHEAIAKKIS